MTMAMMLCLIPSKISRYYIPASMNNLEQRIHVNPNTELFDMDKAFVTINYPLDGDMNRMGWSVKDVLDKIAVGEGGKKSIIKCYQSATGGYSKL